MTMPTLPDPSGVRSPARFRVEVPLRHTDGERSGGERSGQLSLATVADYLQEARVDFLLATPGRGSAMLDTGVVVVSHQIECREGLTYSAQPLVVEVGISGLGAARFEVDYQVVQAGRWCARARSVMCPFDLEQQRPRRLTDAERAWFGAHRVVAEALPELHRSSATTPGSQHWIRPRWSDVDRFHHVNNVRVFDYVHEGLSSPAWWGELSAGQHRWQVARQDLDYLGQLTYRSQPYLVVTTPVTTGPMSATFATEIIDPLAADRVVARALTVLARRDRQAHPQAHERLQS